jgi:phosphocarrier protein
MASKVTPLPQMPRNAVQERGMAERIPVASRRVAVVSRDGLYMRAAARFVCVSRAFRSAVTVSCGGARASGGSILDLICLAAERGSILDLEAQGADAEQAVDALVALVSAGFPESPDERVA